MPFQIHKKNGGACEARNTGLKHVTGEYITIVDGDDWLERDYVEYLMKLIHQTNADMAMTDRIFTTRDRIQVENDYVEKWSPETAFCGIIYPKIPIGPWNKMYSTDLVNKNNISFSVPWSGEGLYFSAMAAQYSNCVAVGHRKIYNYRLNNIQSGLTNYKLIMGINALENIINIGKCRYINTKRTENAVNWHVWKNYNYILFLIIATDSTQENERLFTECLGNIRRRLAGVLLHAELGVKVKIKMLIQGLFPVRYAKHELRRQKRELVKDKME